VAHGGDGAQQWGSYWKEWPPAAGAAVSGVGAARRSTRRNPPPRAIMTTFTVPAPAATDARGAVLTLACPAEEPLPPLGMRARRGVAIPRRPQPATPFPLFSQKIASRVSSASFPYPSPDPFIWPAGGGRVVAAGRLRRRQRRGPHSLPPEAPVDVFGQVRDLF